jgi:uncharacterized protein (TIGR02118 family)
MAKLIILYGQPKDPGAFEDYYSHRHPPFAQQMPNVRDAELSRVVGAPEGGEPPYYRIAQMSFDSVADLRAAISTEEGKAVLADLPNFATGGATVLISDSA